MKLKPGDKVVSIDLECVLTVVRKMPKQPNFILCVDQAGKRLCVKQTSLEAWSEHLEHYINRRAGVRVVDVQPEPMKIRVVPSDLRWLLRNRVTLKAGRSFEWA